MRTIKWTGQFKRDYKREGKGPFRATLDQFNGPGSNISISINVLNGPGSNMPISIKPDSVEKVRKSALVGQRIGIFDHGPLIVHSEIIR